MRILVIVAGCVLAAAGSAPANADLRSDLDACLAAAMARVKAAGYSNKATDIASKEIDLCSAAADRAWERENRDNSRTDAYYDLEAWKADQQYKRDIEAVNRDYNLRRAGVLP